MRPWNTVEWQVSERRALVHPVFGSWPVLQLDLGLDIRWTIERPEPE